MTLAASRPDFEEKESLITRERPRKNLVTGADINALLLGVQALYDSAGWESYTDGQYTALSKRDLASGVPAQITINGATSIVDQAPGIEGHTPFWAGNLIRSNNDGATLSVRLNFEASISSNDAYITYRVFIGPAFDVKVTSGTLLFPKGPNVDHEFSELFTLFSRDTFLTTGAKIVFTPSANAKIWNQSIFIESLFSGR